jgi:hypothetical protein
MEKRIEQFELKGKKRVSYDLSHLKNNAEFKECIQYAKEAVRRYPQDNSLLSIFNVEGGLYDTETKNIIAEWMEFYRPYIRQGAVIGPDGIKRVMIKSILKKSGRTNMKFFRTRDDAVKWLAVL